MADQAGLSYGKIVGRFVGIVADTGDAGESPDAMPMEGVVSFIPEVTGPIKLLSAVPPVTIVPTTIQVTLDDDGDIAAPDPANGEGVYLVATDETNPVDWTYRVAFALTLNGQDVPMPSFSISVPAGSTQDLAVLIPASTSTGEPLPVTYNWTSPPTVQVGTGATPPIPFADAGLYFREVSPGRYKAYLEDGS
jgi:hypothetical protein